jgi:hypothetical protein
VVSPSSSDSFFSNGTFDLKLPASPAQRSADSTTIIHEKKSKEQQNAPVIGIANKWIISAGDGTSIGDSKNLDDFWLDDFWRHGYDFIYWISVPRSAINLYWILVAQANEIQLSLPHNWMIPTQVYRKC